MATITKGDTSAQEMRDSGRKQDKLVTFHFNGARDAVDSAMPDKGDTYRKGNESYRVKSRTLTPKAGGMAEGTITCVPKHDSSDSGSDDDLYEVDMVEMEKSILTHPKYREFAEMVNAWRKGSAAMQAVYEYWDVGGTILTITDDTAKECCDKIRKGIESYLVYAPVIRKTTTVDSIPNDYGLALGHRFDSLDIDIPGDWQWLKRCDKLVPNGDSTWQRIEEWGGADEWDEDLYEEATSD